MFLRGKTQLIKTYFSNIGIYLIASLISAGLGVAINPLLALSLSPTDYAIISYFTSLGTFVTPIIGFFIIDYYIRYYYRVSESERIIIKGTVLKLLVFSQLAVSLICIIGVSTFVVISDSSFDAMPCALYVVANLYFLLPYQLKTAEYKMAGESKKFAFHTILLAVINILTQLLFVVVLKKGANGKLSASMLYAFLSFVYVTYSFRNYFSIKLDKRICIDILKYAYPLVLAAILNFFSNGFDKILLEQKGDIEELGYYAVACQMVGYISIFSTSIKSTFQPDMYKAIAEKNIKKVCTTILLVLGGVTLLVGLFYVFCPYIIDILTAGRYVKSTGLARIVCLSAITSTLYFQISQFTFGVGLTKLVLYNKIIGTILTIITFYFMINMYGVLGAAWGITISWLYFAFGNVILLAIKKNELFK